jgi:hypothetical protein
MGGSAFTSGVYVIGSTFKRLSPLDWFDFLLTFTFDDGTAPDAE